MADFLHASTQQDAVTADAAVVRVNQLHALAELLSLEEVVEQFSALSTVAQVSIFGLFEDALADIRIALEVVKMTRDSLAVAGNDGARAVQPPPAGPTS
ncbi:hypothetical protein [Paraburkholderia sp. J41]|uniref:hypothetical protein n=1 Tax=Paraburkholderia sp. J41 TaxID=2805433 RepID=UPI002AC35DA2|nr:hypothetical protein [Paraburkholderia sp. J41]